MTLPELSWVFRLLLAIFTCYRLSRLIAKDDGPFFLFERVRHWLREKKFAEFDSSGWSIEFEDEFYGKWKSLYDGLTCPYCVGVWLSIPLFFMFLYPTMTGDLFLILMSISAGQTFLQSLGK